MQINFFANQSNAAGETAAKATECTDTGCLSAFFAQLGQILKQGREQKSTQGIQSSAAKVPGAGRDIQSGPMPETHTLSPIAVNAGKSSTQQQTAAAIPFLEGCDKINAGVQTAIHAGIATQELNGSMNTTVPESAQNYADSEKKEIVSLISVFGFSFDLSDVVAAAHSEIPISNSVPSAGLQSGWNLNIPNSGEKQAENAMQSQFPEFALNNSNPAGNNSGKLLSLEGLNAETEPNLQTLNSGSEIASQLSSAAKSENSQAVDGLRVAPDSRSQNQSNRATANPESVDRMLQAVLDSANIETATLIRNAAGKESVLRKILQTNLEHKQLDLDFPSTVSPEYQKYMLSRPEWQTTIGSSGNPDNPILSLDAKSQNGHSQEGALGKPDNPAKSAAEGFGKGDPSSEQDAAKDILAGVTSQQGKITPEPFNSGQLRIISATRPPQTQSSLISSLARSTESASPSSTPSAPDSTTQSAGFLHELADQIRVQFLEGKGVIRIQLKPDSLGRLEIKAESTVSGVAARITTESSAVKNYLESNLQFLQQTLQDQGLRIDRIHIVVQDALDSQSSSEYTAQPGHSGSGHSRRESQSSSESSSSSTANSLDEISMDSVTWLALNPNNRFYTVA